MDEENPFQSVHLATVIYSSNLKCWHREEFQGFFILFISAGEIPKGLNFFGERP